MNWVNGAGWHHERAREIAKLLAAAYETEIAMNGVLDSIGEQSLKSTGTILVEATWYDILKKLHAVGRIPTLLNYVSKEYEELKDRFYSLSVDPAVGYGNPDDRYEALLTGPGSIPFVDRDSFREALREFIDKRLPVLIVYGKEKSGKSHSYELINHVFLGCTEPIVSKIDFLDSIDGSTAADLMVIMRDRLGVPPRRRINIRTGSAMDHVRKIINEFIGDYNQSHDPRFRRIIVIDGADRVDIDEDVLALVRLLINNCVDNQLFGCQLIVIGFRGNLTGNIRFKVKPDETSPITGIDVRAYFTALIRELGNPKAAEGLDQVVESVMEQGPDLRLMSEKIRIEALKMVDDAR